MSEARVISIRNPWAWAIVHGGKDVENRTTNIAGEYRGAVLIHVSKAYADGWESKTLADLMNQHPGVHEEPQPWHDHAGMIIGVADLLDVHQHKTVGGCLDTNSVSHMRSEVCSPWAEEGAVHLVLANPRALDEPIPYRGALGLRKTNFFVSGDWLGEYVEPDPKHGMCTPYGCPPSCYSEPVARLVAAS